MTFFASHLPHIENIFPGRSLHLHGFFLYPGIFDLPTCGISGGIHIDGASLRAVSADYGDFGAFCGASCLH